MKLQTDSKLRQMNEAVGGGVTTPCTWEYFQIVIYDNIAFIPERIIFEIMRLRRKDISSSHIGKIGIWTCICYLRPVIFCSAAKKETWRHWESIRGVALLTPLG